MTGVLRSVRSALSLLGVFLWLALAGFPALYLWVLPGTWIRPRKRRVLLTWYVNLFVRGIFALLRAGGARFRRTGTLRTERPVLILMNHQSLVDILTVTVLSSPYTPAFVTRRRYARFIPVISPSIRLLGCPIIDPKRDRAGAIAALRDAAPIQEHGLLIFPEGHRTRDGEIQPFKAAGVQAILGARRMPVYVVVTDGFWTSRRLVDFVFGIHTIRGETDVLGPFESPASEADVPAFLEGMRERMVARLRQMRDGRVVAP